MATSIGVQESTRDRLERLKREVGASSLEEVIATLLEEHEELKSRQASDRLLLAVSTKRKDVARLARHHGIQSMSIFGSALHGDAKQGSDLDLLVRFAPGKTPGLIGLGAIERELSDLLGVRVDLQTPGALSSQFREKVLAEALEIHAAP